MDHRVGKWSSQRRRAAVFSLVALAALACRLEGVAADPVVLASVSEETRTPTAAPFATVLPTPAPNSSRLREAGEEALRLGDYELAIALLEGALEAASAEMRPLLLPSLTRARFAAEQYEQVLELWAAASVEELPEADQALVWGLIASSHAALGQWPESIVAYELCLALEDAAAYHLRRQIAEAYQHLDQPQQAAAQLQALDLSDLDRSTQADIWEELGDLSAKLGADQAALDAYDQILSFAQVAYYRSTILWKKGQLLLEMGREDDAVAALRQAVTWYPRTWGAYASLQLLDQLDRADISLLERGQILYAVGQYAQSIDALAAYRRANPYGFHSTAHYYAGLVQHAQGEYAQAIAEYNAVIRDFSWTQAAGDAWMAKARSLAALDEDAAGTYRQFAALYPQHTRAPEALWLAAVALERQGEWEEAGECYAALRGDYPDDTRAAEASFRTALACYALGDFAGAAELWEQGLASGQAADTAARARLWTWMGLASLGAGDPAAAASYWRQASAAAPHSYYGLRAKDLLEGRSLFMPSTPAHELAEFQPSNLDWRLIQYWLARWSPQEWPPETAVADQPLVRRGKMLWDLGWHSEGLRAYRQFRNQILDDPPALLALAGHCVENDVWALVIPCAERLVALGERAGAEEPPVALRKLAYPSAYGQLIRDAATLQGLDPLLFLALVRQESQFNPFVSSWAGAVGLTQVMPQTGAWIAQRLGELDFHEGLLLRPIVSARYGSWYLGQALDLFERHWVPAVASYNAGWTSVQSWVDGKAVSDVDLFVETIPLAETKAFVQLVYEHLRAYESIYRD
jgi:soluble lytic murein transglycosylase